MPLPIPFYLRTTQTTALTHAELDGNLSILSTKIDNTTCGNIGTGIGIFRDKEVGNNDGVMNLYSLSGTNGILIGITGDSVVIDGSGVGGTTFWEEFGTSNGALKDVKGTYNTSGTSTNSLIAGGDLHIVHSTTKSFIGGGQGNMLLSASTSAIIGGRTNTILEEPGDRLKNFNVIMGGRDNTIEGQAGAIIGGSGNTVYRTNNTLMGVGNICSGDTSLVFGGVVKTGGYVGNTVSGRMNFVGGTANNVNSSDFNSILGYNNFSQASNVFVYGSGNEINSGGTMSADFTQSFVAGLNIELTNDVTNCTAFGQQNRVGGIIIGEEEVQQPTNTLIAGSQNTITGQTSSVSILAGINNQIGDEAGVTTRYSSILAGSNNKIGFIGKDCRDTSIISGAAMSGFSDSTSYAQKLQVTEKVRVSSYDYITTNNITATDSPTIHNVVHDSSSISAIPARDGGGEIVRYGICGSEEVIYQSGQFVYLDSDGCWKRTDVSVSGRTDGRMVGFALSNNPVIAGTGKGILIRGHLKLATLPEGALPGQPLYLDASVTGAVTPTPPASSGNIVRAVGHLIGGPSLDPEGGYMFLNPDITYLQVS